MRRHYAASQPEVACYFSLNRDNSAACRQGCLACRRNNIGRGCLAYQTTAVADALTRAPDSVCFRLPRLARASTIQ